MESENKCLGVYPTLAASDVTETCNWYVEKLGFTIRFILGEPPVHGAILFDEACVHFRKGTPQLNDNWLYFHITDVDAMHEHAKANGVEITLEPESKPWGMREFNAIDLNGYQIRFGQNLVDTG